MSFDIIINPEYDKLIKEIEQLKEQISELIETEHYLRFHECKLLQAKYMSEIGCLEYKVYEFDIKYRRLKRKVELYQACINKQEPINVQKIENQLDEEYKEYEDKIKKMYDEIQDSLKDLNATVLSENTSKEIKTLYRKLIKKLHPDLNPNYSEKDKNLLLQVEQAFQNGDFKTLKNIEILIEEIDTNNEQELGELDELRNNKKKYAIMVEDLQMAIDKIKNEFPYNEIDFLSNPERIAIRQKELRATIDNYKIAYGDLQERLKKLKEINNE